MTRLPKFRNRWITGLVLLVAVGIWLYEQKPLTGSTWTVNRQSQAPTGSAKGPQKPAQPAPAATRIGGYEVHHGCTLVEARNNDGDSFILRLPEGRQAEFRLYFVDTPESAFKSYRSGETNRQRIAEQAAAMGGISPEQAVAIGQQAKRFTLALLASRPFTIYTEWDSPFRDERFHAHIEVKTAGKTRWLDELLVENGYVRIHTKPARMPDGTPANSHKSLLKDLERNAKKTERGVWGL